MMNRMFDYYKWKSDSHMKDSTYRSMEHALTKKAQNALSP